MYTRCSGGSIPGFMEDRCHKTKYQPSTDILRISKVERNYRYPKYHNFSNRSDSTDMLEISQLFWFEDILVSQKIYAIVYDCSFIAAIESCKRYVFIIDCFRQSNKLHSYVLNMNYGCEDPNPTMFLHGLSEPT